MPYLKKISFDDSEKIYEMLQEIDANDNGFHNKVNGMTYAEFLDWLKQENDFNNGINLLNWMVPQSSFWLFKDDTPIGVGRIRHYLNDSLQETGGHIGYAIRKTQRGKGYGKKILGLLIEECKKLNIESVQVGTNVDNIYSNKVILHNGGIWFKENNRKNFYHINLAE